MSNKLLYTIGLNEIYSLVHQNAFIRITRTSELHKKQTSIVQELCESRGGRPGLSVLTSLLVSVDVKL